MRVWHLLTIVGGVAWAWHGCADDEGCLTGDDGICMPPSPCQALAFACEDPSLELSVVRGAGDRPPGLDALAARGDVLLGNSRMLAIVDGIEAPHYLAPSGGALLDLVPRAGSAITGNDELNVMLQAVGILPDDAARYHRLELHDGRPEFVAAIARGRLDGRPDIEVVTRYEARPCEPGLRVRTEIYQGSRDPLATLLSDAFYWGGREVTPFVPLPGQGYVLPDLDLLELDASIFEIPLMAAPGHAPGAAAYGVVRCDAPAAEAFQSGTVSAMGRERAVLMPGDGIAYERFVAVAAGPGAAGAIDSCLLARGMLFEQTSVRIEGRVLTPDGSPVGGDERRVSLWFEADGTPWSEAVPAADGTFALRVPADLDFVVRPHALGRALPTSTAFRSEADKHIGDIVVPPTGIVNVSVSDEAGTPVIADIVLVVASPTRAEDVSGSIYGVFADEMCAPYLGPPHGGSPACNRALVRGSTSFAAPAGHYFVYASRGPFAMLARQRIEVRAGAAVDVSLAVERLPDLLPPGVLSADFHVHSGASFDSSLPEIDRALSFVATGVDALAATDHDVVTTYADAIAELGIGDQVVVMPGVETTGEILFNRPPGSEIPEVIGHYNFWPLKADRALPRNGAPWDEKAEPGALFDRVEPLFDGSGVRQLNHPFAGSVFGRDEGFLSAVDYDPRVAVPATETDTPEGQLPRVPGGGASNIDHHVQEVMNGASTKSFANYRIGWHSFLDQGIVRGGTANSDSHTLAVEVLGYPRNLVFGGHTLATFNRERFNEDVRNGRMIGTNGPVLLACIDGADGTCHEPSLTAFAPASGARLHLELRAAPWIPIAEIRVVVNGVIVRTIAALMHPSDPFGRDGILRYTGEIALDELLTDDGWIVVEAGLPIWPAADLDDDGLLETTDNNRDGVIDARDQEGIEDEEDYYREPPPPHEGDARFHLYAVAPGTYPTSFTNPWLIDRTGDGWLAPGLP